MMGQKSEQSKLFYQFSLEERVPEDHLLLTRLFGSYLTELNGGWAEF